MTREDLVAQRAELVRAEADHLGEANAARGAIRLIDYWLARDEFRAPAPEPAQEREGG